MAQKMAIVALLALLMLSSLTIPIYADDSLCWIAKQSFSYCMDYLAGMNYATFTHKCCMGLDAVEEQLVQSIDPKGMCVCLKQFVDKVSFKLLPSRAKIVGQKCNAKTEFLTNLPSRLENGCNGWWLSTFGLLYNEMNKYE